MGFRWNGIHTNDIRLHAEPEILPMFPEPKIVTEEVPAADGFYDFTAFNNSGRAHYHPRDWAFLCHLEGMPGAELSQRLSKIAEMFAVRSGYLEVDGCPGVRWEAMITNRWDVVKHAPNMRGFPILFRSQPFAEGLDGVILPFDIAGSGTVIVENPGTWYVRPDIYLTGEADNAVIGGMPVFEQGALGNVLAWGPELAPGSNAIAVEGFVGSVEFKFTPLYVWGLS